MVVVPCSPTWHRALLDAIHQTSVSRLAEQGNKVLGEIQQVLVHAQSLVPPNEPADGVYAQQRGSIEDPQHEFMFLLPDRRIMMEHVVEIAEVRYSDLLTVERILDPPGSGFVEGLTQVECIGDRIKHRFGWNIRFGRVQRGRELNVIYAELAGELYPVLDCPVGVGITDFPRSQLLQCCSQHSNAHEFRLELLD